LGGSGAGRGLGRVRCTHASCAALGGGALITAVRTEDMVSDEGVVDQSHTVAAGCLSPEGQGVEQLNCHVSLNHGLLSDPVQKSEVWGYLGNRLRPGVLPGGVIWWERKQKHDGLTTRTTGVLCCKSFDPVSQTWSGETTMHQGGLAYHVTAAFRDRITAVSSWDTYIHDAEDIRSAWDSGRRLCLIGGSDGHRRQAGLGGACTGVWARELSLRGIWEAIKKRRTVATQGRRPLILFSVTDEEKNTLFIGDHGKLQGRLKVGIEIDVQESGDDRIELVELLHRERMLANWSLADTVDSGRRLEVEYEPYSFGPGAKQVALNLAKPNYLYLRIKFSGSDHQFFSNVAPAWGPWAWTIPIWWD